jgi:hypothetical protein
MGLSYPLIGQSYACCLYYWNIFLQTNRRYAGVHSGHGAEFTKKAGEMILGGSFLGVFFVT